MATEQEAFRELYNFTCRSINGQLLSYRRLNGVWVIRPGTVYKMVEGRRMGLKSVTDWDDSVYLAVKTKQVEMQAKEVLKIQAEAAIRDTIIRLAKQDNPQLAEAIEDCR